MSTSPIVLSYVSRQTLMISIVFVHGLRGHRVHTWTKDGICWPKDLLPREPALSNVRILSFGYDSKVVDFGRHASLQDLFKHSISLLNDLCPKRVDDVGFVSSSRRLSARSNQQDRPIIFIAHSLGGLVVKDVCHQIFATSGAHSLLW